MLHIFIAFFNFVSTFYYLICFLFFQLISILRVVFFLILKFGYDHDLVFVTDCRINLYSLFYLNNSEHIVLGFQLKQFVAC